MEDRHDNPAISVCIPVYNAARYIGECIDSILAQTFTDYEILIADDGSTDDTLSIVATYTDPRIRVIHCNHNYIATLNRLIDEARGRYIARMDADDVMCPDRLQLQYEYKELHDKTKFLAGKAETYAQIMNNVKTAVGLHLPITLRCNCTMKNIFSFIDVAKELGQLSDEEKKYILIDIQPVWQEPKTDLPEFREGLKSLHQAFKKEKFHVRNDKTIDLSRCCADKDNGLVINCNGDVYSCTARDFIKDNKEGIITPQGEIVWNDRKQYRISLKYGNDTCRKCTIYPICHGKCTQYKMETGLNVGCICNYTDGKRKEIIESRISFLINNQLKN